MNFLDKLTKRFTQSATVAVKQEVQKTAIDLIPAAFGIIATIASFFIFKDTVINEPLDIKPAVTNTSITTNNYFFQQVDEDLIRKILSSQR